MVDTNKIIGNDNIDYPRYFGRGPNNPLWLKCIIPEDIPGGPYWDEKKDLYSIPLSVVDYRFNKEKCNLSLLEDYTEENFKIIKGLTFFENLNFKKGDQFELLLKDLNSIKPIICHTWMNGIDKIIREHK